EGVVLRLGEGHVVRAFELDADGEIIAAGPSLPLGGARMPGAVTGEDVLAQLAVTPDEEVRGNLEALDLLEVGMRQGIEAVLEERVDPRAAEFTGRERDRV